MSVRRGLRLMAVHAHPDDESSKGAATTAMYAAQGAEVLVVSCTGGERGDILNPALREDPRVQRDIAEFRREEMAQAAEILGVQHVWLGFVDSGLPDGDPLPPLPPGCFALEPIEVTTEALVRVIRDFRPHVMTTYNELGGYPHPDHISTHTVAMSAFTAAGDPTAYPHAGEPWAPLKIYYDITFSKGRVEVLHDAIIALGEESPYAQWLENWTDARPVRQVTTRVVCDDYFETRNRALIAHATQVDPDGPWFRVSLDVQRRVWPTEDWEAALSAVPIAADEDDLFAGLGTAEEADRLALTPELTIVYDGRVTTAQEESP